LISENIHYSGRQSVLLNGRFIKHGNRYHNEMKKILQILSGIVRWMYFLSSALSTRWFLWMGSWLGQPGIGHLTACREISEMIVERS